VKPGQPGARRAGPKLRAMRVAALYDIHGNDAALAAVLAELGSLDVDLIVLGGDIAGGPFPCETVDAVRALGDRAIAIRGNGERELVEARLHLDSGTERIDPSDVWSSRTHWAAGVLDRERLEWMAALPAFSSVVVDGLGDVLFCHATPRSDEERVTVFTPDERIAELVALAPEEPAVVVAGHTHRQFDRPVAGGRMVNAGSVGRPYEPEPAAYWLRLEPEVRLQRTEYDTAAAAAAFAALGYPMADGMVSPVDADGIARRYEDIALEPTAEESRAGL
jgi:predicted phosphodiesterase